MSKQMIVDGKQIRHVMNEKKLLNSLQHNFVLGALFLHKKCVSPLALTFIANFAMAVTFACMFIPSPSPPPLPLSRPPDDLPRRDRGLSCDGLHPVNLVVGGGVC